MRSIVQKFIKGRGQRLQLCYGPDCSDATSNVLVQQSPNTYANNARADKCAENQIVYGHGVHADIAERLNLPDAGSARVAMIREPLAWAISLYKEFFGSGRFHGSFDDWIQQSDRAQMCWVDMITGRHGTSSETVEKWDEWVKQKQPLILFTDRYEASVSKLAEFFGASAAEEQNMLAAISHANSRPDHKLDLTLSKATHAKLQQILEPCEIIYRNSWNADSAAKESRRTEVEVIEQQGGMLNITIPASWQDDEE